MANMMAAHLHGTMFQVHVKNVVRCLFRCNFVLKGTHGPCGRHRTVCWRTSSSVAKPLSLSLNSSGVFIRLLCSDTDLPVKAKRGRKVTVPNEETKRYLTFLGLDCDLIQQNQPMVLVEDVSNVQNRVNFLQNLDLSEAEVVAILRKSPELLKVDATNIQEHIQFLQDLGLEGLLILNIFQRVPRFFATPLSRIRSNMEYIQSLNLTNKNLRILLKYFPSLFYRRKNGVRYIGECLRRVVLEHDPSCNAETALRYMIRSDPLLFGRTVGEIEHHVQHLISLGFTGVSLAKIIRFCPSVLRIGTGFITERLLLMQRCLSLSSEESLDMVMRLPKILNASDHTIETKCDYLFKRGFVAADIYRNPRVLNASLQRIESRLDKLEECNFRPKSLSFILQTDDWFENFLEEIKQRKKMDHKTEQTSEK
ncbi:uncharacterized protein LOC110981484 [Acanthaster planci]|uniref:Uncharacterized protein LOC110981484 n=1 Tax=Acanthaster planci TaxID=133434 RepID=A0A8B7YQ24_ACAPL|nr:uncharacterized protein LOC110981484 [Acanthaster planci]XP_022094789.1 uncharacterized protein LOC110981484 [Acanthaster planci]XP_022094798.1 uncharacterized protein LOC110981484 [Acanthaster planci]